MKPIDPAERARIIDDLHVMLTRLVDRKRDFDFIRGDAATDTELLWLHKNIGSIVRRHQETFPKGQEVVGE